MENASPRKRRALFVADRFPPQKGAAARTLAEAVSRFPAGEAVISAPQRPHSAPVDRALNCEVRRARTFVGPQGFGLRLWRIQLNWLVGRSAPSLVVACGAGSVADMACSLEDEHGLPFVLRLEMEDVARLRSDLLAGADRGHRARDLVERTAAIVVPTRSAWRKAYKLHTHPHDITVIRPGVDLERFRPGPASDELKARLGATNDPVVLAVSECDPMVDAESIFRAFAVVRSQLRRAILLVAGLGGGEHRSLLRKLRIDRAVRFLDPTPAELPDLYRTADLFLTAHTEDRRSANRQGTEIALIEAMASGLPIAATHTDATSDLMPDDECMGVLVEPGAHAKLGRAALDVLRARELAAELGQGARRHAEATYDASRNATELRDLVEVILVRRLRRESRAPAEVSVHPAA